MIVWLNGSFGAGKTTTARELVQLLPDSRIFDSEYVGYMLRHVLTGTNPVENFQEWPPWRSLVVRTAVDVHRHVGGALVIPQTVLEPGYFEEISTGLAAAGLPVHHFVLHVPSEILTTRIENDTVETAAKEWRLKHIPRYESALPWLRQSATVLDTSELPPRDVAQRIADQLGDF
jgi:hypothetical protein